MARWGNVLLGWEEPQLRLQAGLNLKPVSFKPEDVGRTQVESIVILPLFLGVGYDLRLSCNNP